MALAGRDVEVRLTLVFHNSGATPILIENLRVVLAGPSGPAEFVYATDLEDVPDPASNQRAPPAGAGVMVRLRKCETELTPADVVLTVNVETRTRSRSRARLL